MTPIDFANYQRELNAQRERFLEERRNMTATSLFEEDNKRVIITDTYLRVTSEERARLKEDWGKLNPNCNYDGEIEESLEDINEMFKDIHLELSKPPQEMKKPLQHKSTNDTKNNPLF